MVPTTGQTCWAEAMIVVVSCSVVWDIVEGVLGLWRLLERCARFIISRGR